MTGERKVVTFLDNWAKWPKHQSLENWHYNTTVTVTDNMDKWGKSHRKKKWRIVYWIYCPFFRTHCPQLTIWECTSTIVESISSLSSRNSILNTYYPYCIFGVMLKCRQKYTTHKGTNERALFDDISNI